MFSVIIPVHNKLPHIDRSINSVLTQSFQDFEIILIDDASTDGSSEKIATYKDSRIRKFKRDIPGPGGYAARNLGIEKAKFDWICFLDADDLWDSDFLKEFKLAIDKNPNAKILSCQWKNKTETSTINKNITKKATYSNFELLDYLKDTTYMWTCAIMVNKSVIQEANTFPKDKKCKRGGDVDTWIRWLYKSEKNIRINKELAYYFRDTVNQVTDVPNTYFCAYQTLKDIYKQEKTNSELRKAVKGFTNRFLYGMLYRQVMSGMKIDYKEIKKMYFNKYSVLRFFKLHKIKYLGK